MNQELLRECKRVIMNNKKYKGFVYLTLADKCKLLKLTRKLKKDGNINNITFEEFVLLCKHHKTKAVLRLESKYSTLFVDLLNFNHYTLHITVMKILKEIELHHEDNRYNNLDSIVHSMNLNHVISFDYFKDLCQQLNVKIHIE